MVYCTKRFVVCLTLCYFVLVFFSPFSIAISSLGEERANLSAFRTFVQFVLVWFCWFPLPLGVWEGLRFVIVALPDFFSYLFFTHYVFDLISPTEVLTLCHRRKFGKITHVLTYLFVATDHLFKLFQQISFANNLSEIID